MATKPKGPGLPRHGQRFTDRSELFAAVRRQCEAEWHDFAGEPWSEEWRDHFDQWEYVKQVRAHYATEEKILRDFLAVVERASAHAAKRAAAGKTDALCSHLVAMLEPEVTPAVRRWIEMRGRWTPRDWSRRSLFVVSHHEGAFLRPGHRATLRELAIVSLLIGNEPTIQIKRLRDEGYTAAEVIEAESRNVDDVRARWPAIGEKQRRSRASR